MDRVLMREYGGQAHLLMGRAHRRGLLGRASILMILALAGSIVLGAKTPVRGSSIGLEPMPDSSAAEELTAAMFVQAERLHEEVETLPQGTMACPVEWDGPLVMISRSEQMIMVFDADGAFLGSHQCATGVYYPLPGRYRILERRPASSSSWDGSRFTYFTVFALSHRGTAIGFHSIPVDGRGVPVAGLGISNSHGCVRLEEEVAEFLYDWLTDDALVVVAQ